MLCDDNPRGLSAFHSYDVPNTGIVERLAEPCGTGGVYQLQRIGIDR